MDAKFWISAWDEGRTGFHRSQVNEKLLNHFPKLDPQTNQSVLVPLCGKSKDLLWLGSLGLKVHGVELYSKAVEEFFTENNLTFNKTQNSNFTDYTFDNILLSSGDFMKLNKDGVYDLIYDRASLVALPKEMRKEYASVLKRALKKDGKYLLVTYEYNQTQMDGPPFSVDANEVHSLFEDQFTIKLVESTSPNREGPRFSVLDYFREKVYILEKVR